MMSLLNIKHIIARTMRWLTLIVAIAVIVAISTLAFAPGSPVFKKADGRYLVIAHFPPFKQAELEKALDEIKPYVIWTSWYGDVGLPLKPGRQVVEEMFRSPLGGVLIPKMRQIATTEDEEGVIARITSRGDLYVLEVYNSSKPARVVNKNGIPTFVNDTNPVLTYSSRDLEDVLWVALNETKKIYGFPDPFLVELLYSYKYDVPLMYGAFAIPFCNGTYYGPDMRPLGVVLNGAVKLHIFPENRTVIPISLPSAVSVRNYTRMGGEWYGHYVIDVCLLPKVEKQGIVAIVDGGRLTKVIEILEKYIGEKPHVRPIS